MSLAIDTLPWVKGELNYLAPATKRPRTWRQYRPPAEG